MIARRAMAWGARLAIVVFMAGLSPVAGAAIPLEPNRLINEWLVVGPFDLPPFSQIPPLDIPIILEEGYVKPTPGEEVFYRGRRLEWEPVLKSLIDFEDLFTGDPNRTGGCAYAYTEVDCAQAEQFALIPIFSDSIKIWVNGELVLQLRTPLDLNQYKDQIAVPFEQGRNSILVKVINRYGYWGLGLSAEPEHGLRVRILEKNSDLAFQLSQLPEAMLDIRDAGGDAHIVTPAIGFGGYYRGSIRPPDLDFQPGRIQLSTKAAPGLDTFQASLDRTEPGSAEANYELALPFNGQLQGRVMDIRSDTPVAGAVVKLGWRGLVETTTDLEGMFLFNGTLPGKNMIQVESPRHHPWRGYFPVVEDDGEYHVILLFPATDTLNGRILNAWTEQPIPGAEIKYNMGPVQGLMTSANADGRFAIPFSREFTNRFWASVIVDGLYYSNFNLPYRFSPEDLNLTIPLNPIQLSLKAELADGQAWTSATATLFHYLFADGEMMKSVRTDEKGRAEFHNLPEGAYLVAVYDAARGVATRRMELRGRTMPALMKAPIGSPNIVTLRHFNGQPLARGRLEVRAFGDKSPIKIEYETNESGQVAIPPMECDQVHLTIRHPDIPEVRFAGPLADLPREVRVPLPRRVVIEAVSEDDGQALLNARLDLRHRHVADPDELIVNVVRAADGRLALDVMQTPLDVGLWTGLIKAPGHTAKTIALNEINQAAANGQALRIGLGRSEIRSVRFLSPAGAELSHVSLAWCNPRFPYREAADRYFPEPMVQSSGQTVSAQTVMLAGEQDGWSALAWKPYYGYALIAPGQEWTPTIKLRQFARLSGRIQLTGLPRQEAYVKAISAGELEAAGIQIVRVSPLRPGGRFEFANLIPGLWRLEVYNSGDAFANQLDTLPVYTTTVRADSQVSTFIQMPADNAGSVTGTVVFANGEPMVATILLERAGAIGPEPERFVMHTDWEGRFLMDGVLPGDWRIRIHPRYSSWGRPYFTDHTRELTESFTLGADGQFKKNYVFTN